MGNLSETLLGDGGGGGGDDGNDAVGEGLEGRGEATCRKEP